MTPRLVAACRAELGDTDALVHGTPTGILSRRTTLRVAVDARGRRALTLGTAVATGAALLFAPLVSTSSCSTTSTGISSCTSSQASLIANEGAAVAFPLLLPAFIALVPVVANTLRSTFAAAAVLTVATVLGLASIGIFSIPTVALAWGAVSATREFDRNQQPRRSSARQPEADGARRARRPRSP